MNPRAFVGGVLLLTAACGRPPETRIIVVTATPPPVVAAPISVSIEPTPTAPEQTAAFDLPMVTATEAPVAAAATPLPLLEFHIANRDPTPTPASLREQMEQCVNLTVEQDYGGGPLTGAARVRVKAKNLCNVAFAWSDVWIEVRARPLSAEGILGREVGHLHSEITPLGQAEGVFVVPGASNGPFHRFDAVLWWAAGGGRKPGE